MSTLRSCVVCGMDRKLAAGGLCGECVAGGAHMQAVPVAGLLTETERTYLEHAGQGFSPAQAAERMGMTPAELYLATGGLRGGSNTAVAVSPLAVDGPVPGQLDPRAACRAADRALFFAPDGERGPGKDRREAAAKAVCRRCPIVDECLAWALGARIQYGVWGGMTEAERRSVLRRGGVRIRQVAA